MSRSMESGDGSNGGSGGLVVTELSHIKELVRQLEAHLGGSDELCRHLATEIFSLTERSIGIITAASSSGLDARKREYAGLASPLPATPSSDVADGPFRSTKKRSVADQHQPTDRLVFMLLNWSSDLSAGR